MVDVKQCFFGIYASFLKETEAQNLDGSVTTLMGKVQVSGQPLEALPCPGSWLKVVASANGEKRGAGLQGSFSFCFLDSENQGKYVVEGLSETYGFPSRNAWL